MPLRLTLVCGPRDEDPERPVLGPVDAPADGEPTTAVQELDTGAGVCSPTTASKRHADREVASFNSVVQRGENFQFEVVGKHAGDLWVDINDAGTSISIPGYDK
ncbi:hypothetical protein [Halosolutus halophilus]|uniref:hypothetical protein n=1 Tax=Halosolutus halophilus TaxID=1552990 RepID=UPI002234EDCE|nr:hypothetical protein [Halosolutus halophilus]